MVTAKELDSKFTPNQFTIEELQEAAERLAKEKELREYEKLQLQVRSEVKENVTELLTVEKIIANIQRIETQKAMKFDLDHPIDEKDTERFHRILSVVCKTCDILPSELLKNKRTRTNLHPRYILMFATRWLTGMTLHDIGKSAISGKRLHHSTVINSCKVVADAILMNDKSDELLHQFGKVVEALYLEGLCINLKGSKIPDWYTKLINEEKEEPIVYYRKQN